MGHDGLGTFLRYIHTLPDLTYLTLHVVDLSISLLPLSLSLSLPSSQLHISLYLSFLVSSHLVAVPDYLTYWDFLAAASFTPWSRECVRERVCRDAGNTKPTTRSGFPPFCFLFWWFNNDDFQKTIPQNGKCEPYESFGAYTTAINLYDATPHPENIKKSVNSQKKRTKRTKRKN